MPGSAESFHKRLVERSRTSASFPPAAVALVFYPHNPNTRNLMFASNPEMVRVQRKSGSATSRKPLRNDPVQSRVPGIRDPGRDHGRSSGKRSVLPAEVLLLSANYGHRTPVREVAPLPSVRLGQALRARSRKRLLPNRRAPAKQTEAPRSILHSRLRQVPTGLLEL